ncbi:MAG TPA: ParB N-terminal domain-containing protein [Planctomycetota bacterium]|nr:ParB N-terminal domain-containing protein [Planctomycetota bacterium]
MGAKKSASAAPKKPRARKGRAEAKSKGLTPAECRLESPGELRELSAKIEADGGAVLATYREPLGGRPTILAILPIDKVAPTPFQRDLSETHAKRLGETIGKIGRFLDPVIAVASGDQYWTPNGRHRLESMSRLGARAITALVLPDPEIQYKILALNVEKAHNLREKSLEVIRMYRALVAAGGGPETAHVLEFEEPAFATLGICYEHNGRFGGGAYKPILTRVDGWLEKSLPDALRIREERAQKIEKLDQRVAEIVGALQAKGFKSPYLKAFAIARCNPLRFMKVMPPFDEALDDITKRAMKFNAENVKDSDIAATAGPASDGD